MNDETEQEVKPEESLEKKAAKKNEAMLAGAILAIFGLIGYSYYISLDIEKLNSKLTEINHGVANTSPQENSDEVKPTSKFILPIGVCKKSYVRVNKTEAEINTEIEQLRSLGKDTNIAKQKTIQVEICPPAKYCDPTSVLNNIQFFKKDYDSAVPDFLAKKGKYVMSNFTITIMPSKTRQRVFAITSWDDKNNVSELVIDGKVYNLISCKSPEGEKAEEERIKADIYNKEKELQDKIKEELQFKEKVAQEFKERIKVEKEIIENVKVESEKIEKALAELQKIENEKKIREAIERNKKENEAAEKEKLEKEKMQKMKTKVKAF